MLGCRLVFSLSSVEPCPVTLNIRLIMITLFSISLITARKREERSDSRMMEVECSREESSVEVAFGDTDEAQNNGVDCQMWTAVCGSRT